LTRASDYCQKLRRYTAKNGKEKENEKNATKIIKMKNNATKNAKEKAPKHRSSVTM